MKILLLAISFIMQSTLCIATYNHGESVTITHEQDPVVALNRLQSIENPERIKNLILSHNNFYKLWDYRQYQSLSKALAQFEALEVLDISNNELGMHLKDVFEFMPVLPDIQSIDTTGNIARLLGLENRVVFMGHINRIFGGVFEEEYSFEQTYFPLIPAGSPFGDRKFIKRKTSPLTFS